MSSHPTTARNFFYYYAGTKDDGRRRMPETSSRSRRPDATLSFVILSGHRQH
jgi:hypothetical protein